MEKRRVTILISGQPYSFYSDDSDEYISSLEQRANAAMKQTSRFAGQSAYTNAVLSVLFQTDSLLRTEQKMKVLAAGKQAEEPKVPASRKNPVKGKDQETGQVSVWDLLD